MVNFNLLIRKIYRLLRTGTDKSQPYLNYKSYLLESKKSYQSAIFNLTVDLELAWSRSRRGNTSSSLSQSLKRSFLTRGVFNEFLSLCELNHLPITFAVVGHLAITDCSFHHQPPAFKPYWLGHDWYAIDPKTNLKSDPDYYGVDLVEKILKSNQNHEIASHGFSHVDLSDDATTLEVAKFEIIESTYLLKKIERNLTTFIFPNNKPAFINILKENGYKIYRINNNQALSQDNFNLWRFPVGLWLSPNSFSPQEVMALLKLAIKKKGLVNFFCHLYEFKNARHLKKFLSPVFQFINKAQTEQRIKVYPVREIIFKIESNEL